MPGQPYFSWKKLFWVQEKYVDLIHIVEYCGIEFVFEIFWDETDIEEVGDMPFDFFSEGESKTIWSNLFNKTIKDGGISPWH